MGDRDEVGDSILMLLRVFDSRSGVICCAFVGRLRRAGTFACAEAATPEALRRGKRPTLSEASKKAILM